VGISFFLGADVSFLNKNHAAPGGRIGGRFQAQGMERGLHNCTCPTDRRIALFHLSTWIASLPEVLPQGPLSGLSARSECDRRGLWVFNLVNLTDASCPNRLPITHAIFSYWATDDQLQWCPLSYSISHLASLCCKFILHIPLSSLVGVRSLI
jgi:hypothetical protein